MTMPRDQSARATRSHIRLGCQTITWDPHRVEKREHTVHAVAEAGYDGVEIGAPFLDLDRPAEFRQLLHECGIELVAIHAGFNPFLESVKAGSPPDLDRILEFAQQCGSTFIVLSGHDDQDEFLANLDQVNMIGDRCRKRGLTLCYHNHWWEIQNDAFVLEEVERHTDADLVSFCPDLGWVRKITEDVEGVLNIIAPRIRAVHLKDHVAPGLEPKDNETEFGEGIMDFDSVFQYLQRLTVDRLWVIAEQWKSTMNDLTPEQCIHRNHAFLRRFLGGES
jgi:sugar phosphate isomerase/epimerase